MNLKQRLYASTLIAFATSMGASFLVALIAVNFRMKFAQILIGYIVAYFVRKYGKRHDKLVAQIAALATFCSIIFVEFFYYMLSGVIVPLNYIFSQVFRILDTSNLMSIVIVLLSAYIAYIEVQK